MVEVINDLSEIARALTSTVKMKVFCFWLFLMVLLCLFWVMFGEPNNVTVGISILVCGINTIVFWIFRELLTQQVKKWRMKPSRKFVLIGSLGALWVEFVFWFFEKIFGAAGIAAHPNLLLDYIATMPWYIMMVALLWKVQNRHHYSVKEMLILGGIYELGADGFIGPLFKGQLMTGFAFSIIGIPIFVMVYSIIIVPPTYLLREETKVSTSIHPGKEEHNYRRYFYALLPLLGLVPYFLLFVLLTIFGKTL